MTQQQTHRLDLSRGTSVSAIIDRPAAPRAALVFAHGAGAGMHHRFMSDFARALCDRDVAVLRYQFPFMEDGSKRPDRPAIAHEAVRAAVEFANDHLPGIPLFAGGKSFGGRMTSQAQILAPLPKVAGLVFVGFPLHPASKPGVDRAAHLGGIDVPMLFLQGTRDALAGLDLLRPIVGALQPRATMHEIADADHSFHVRVSSGTNDAAVLTSLAELTTRWMAQVSHWGRPTALA